MKLNLHERSQVIGDFPNHRIIELLNYVFQMNVSMNKGGLFVSAKSMRFAKG